MNTLLSDLSHICVENVLREKWLMAPSLRVGHQWVDSLTRHGTPVMNLRIKTFKGTALDIAGPEMARRGVSLISDLGGTIFVDRILNRLRDNPAGYFASLPPGPALSESMFSAVKALRLAGLGIEELDEKCFEVAAKGTDLAFVLGEYLRKLEEQNLVDYADVVTMAAEELTKTNGALPGDPLVLLPKDLELSRLERDLCGALSPRNRHDINIDEPTPCTPNECKSDAALLSWITAPAEAPNAFRDGTAAIFQAVGDPNEVREVLRRVIASGYRFDEVEILHTDSEIYIPLIFEALVRFCDNSGFDEQSVPATFAEGIPTRYSRPGRALAGWVDWMRNGFSQLTLVNMLQDGLLEISDNPEDISHITLAGILRSVVIGRGRDRYMTKLSEHLAELEPAEHDEPSCPDPGDTATHEVGAYTGTSGTRVLLHLVQGLLAITPTADSSQAEVLAAAQSFLKGFARAANQLDNYSGQALLARIGETSQWLIDDAEPASMNPYDWLSSLPQEVRVGGSGPRPGRLHVAHLMSGGHSGRKHTFMMGLDDGRFPGAGLSDPLLLDGERDALSDDLPKASIQHGLKIIKFARLAARLRGTVNLSLSCHNLMEDRAMFPSPVVFSAYRILSDNKEGDQSDMLRWLGQPASFAPDDPHRSLDETEWWLATLCGRDISNGREVVARHFPHLGRGMIATEARQSPLFTVYDGRIPDVPPDLNPFSASGPVMSASGLETIGSCPLRYFFRYVLRLEPPEDIVGDPTVWLDAMQFGTLLHEVFYVFMSGLISEGRLPLYDRDMGRLTKILDDHVKRYEHLHPPPNPSAFRRQAMQLTLAARIFLLEEEILCRTSRPMYLEASIGMPPQGDPGPLDSREPIELTLPTGGRIRARARIDRVDRIYDGPDPVFSIWDYKTGSTFKYQDPDPFRQGRVIQHALYVLVAAVLLKQKISPSARISHFGYFFPGGRSRGVRIVRPPREIETARRIIENLCSTVSEGCFLATDSFKDDCGFCDYASVCGDPAAVAAAAGRKLAQSENQGLYPLRELRNVGN